LISGCGWSDSTSKPTGPAPSPASDRAREPAKATAAGEQAAVNREFADLVGRVTLRGEIPPPRKLSINKDVEVCGAADTVQDVTGKDGGVADVVVEIKGVEESSDWDWPVSKKGFVIRQQDCQFIPKMLVIPNGEEIKVLNDDPVGHNVNTGAWNVMQPPGGEPIVRPIEGRAPIKMTCNIHVWMESWIYPVQTPFYAVTNETGAYSITGIPPGRYRVMIWHPHLGRDMERVELDAGKVTKLDHEYESN
jgi:hypothetical protein